MPAGSQKEEDEHNMQHDILKMFHLICFDHPICYCSPGQVPEKGILEEMLDKICGKLFSIDLAPDKHIEDSIGKHQGENQENKRKDKFTVHGLDGVQILGDGLSTACSDRQLDIKGIDLLHNDCKLLDKDLENDVEEQAKGKLIQGNQDNTFGFPRLCKA